MNRNAATAVGTRSARPEDERLGIGTSFARQKPGSSVFSEADRYIDFAEVSAYAKLREGDRIIDGRIVGSDGKPVLVRGGDGELVDVRVCGSGGAH